MMEVKQQPRMTFHGVDILNVKFDSTKMFVSNGDEKIDIETNPRVFYPSDTPNHFKIIMDVNLKVNDYFTLEILGIGNFELENIAEEAEKKNFVNINAPAIMFPYVRSFITTFTANLGGSTGALMIPVHFFSGDLEEIIN